MNLKQHAPTDECWENHCAYHNVDEPIEYGTGFHLCGECLHCWPSWEELVMDHNLTVMDLGAYDLTVRFDDPVDSIWICPLCAHSF